jgi:hypothetical protein
VSTFFTLIKGTPSARQAARPGPGRVQGRGSQPGESRAGAEGTASAGRAAGGRIYSGAAACRALRAKAHRARRCLRPAVPAPAASRYPLQRAQGDRASTSWPSRRSAARCAGRRAKGHRDWAGTPRIVRGGPSSVKGTRRSFLPAPQKGSSGPTLERRSLCRPYGPDSKGQARCLALEARGEPIACGPGAYQETGKWLRRCGQSAGRIAEPP